MCPQDYFLNNGHCYGFVDQSLSWYNSRDRCKQLGEEYDLVVVNDNEENQFLKDKIRNQFSGNKYWMGMKENDKDDGFDWIDGSVVSYTDWKSGEPNEVTKHLIFSRSDEICYKLTDDYHIFFL